MHLSIFRVTGLSLFRYISHSIFTPKGNALKKAIVVFFASLLLLVNTPMDFIHLFSGHKDGIHQKHDGLVIEQRHHHCSLLSLSITPFANDICLPVARFYSTEYFTTHVALSAHHYQCVLFSYSLRGPPLA